MARDSLAPLFYPFETGALAWPPAQARILYLGASPALRPPVALAGSVAMVQGFRPDFLALQGAKHPVSPLPQGDRYDLALVLAGRHRGENEARVAEALSRTQPGSLIVIAGGKEDGIASLRKRIGDMVDVEGSESKYHGIVFWFRRPQDMTEAVGTLRARNPEVLVDGRFVTAPGMFSHGHIDTASRLLAEHLPSDLSGRIADFCAGWGYLACEVAARCAKVKRIDLYEADEASLEAAVRNLSVNAPGIESCSFWHDLVDEPVLLPERYDGVVMNPPFHVGRAAEPSMGQVMIGLASGVLRKGGRLLLVANRQLPYETTLASRFARVEKLVEERGFKVFAAIR